MIRDMQTKTGHYARLWIPQAEMDDKAWSQVTEAARQPYVVDAIMVMPDAHGGYGLPVGGVMATDGSVVPYAVGVDIGCGMYAARINVRREELMALDLQALAEKIHAAVPTGLGCRMSAPADMNIMPAVTLGAGMDIIDNNYEDARFQMGTLGGGNHFIELQYDENGYVCVMIHCGSRNLGYKVANHHSKIAADMCSLWQSKADNKELAFLPRGTKEWSRYMHEMQYCIDFASMNRRVIMQAVLVTLIEALGKHDLAMNFGTDICHNAATFENHKGKNVLVHRKGACHVPKGRIGIIPGSMVSGGYIVKGLGNVQAYDSCSHGAGRTMSRGKANKTLDMATEQAKLADTATTLTDLSESDSAYKDLDIVMERQKDLVEIVHHLKPILTVKGSTK